MVPLHAQNSTSDCIEAIPICGDLEDPATPGTLLTWGNDGRGDIDDFDGLTSVGCLEKGSVSSGNVEGNASWFVFRAQRDGELAFDIRRLTPTSEFDFALFGPDPDPDNSTFCAELGAGNVGPIRCNYERNATDYTGIGTNPDDGTPGAPNVVGSNNTYDEPLQVLAGEVYYLFVNNFNTNPNPDPEPFTIEFTESPSNAGQTAVLDCEFGVELGPDIVACEGDPNGIELSLPQSYLSPYITNISWSRDIEDDGVVDDVILSGGVTTEITVDSPNGGRYFVSVQTNLPGNPLFSDDILVTFNGVPDPARFAIDLKDDLDNPAGDGLTYNLSILLSPPGPGEPAVTSVLEYALIPFEQRNNPNFEADYQRDRRFLDIPAGVYVVRVRDTTGCEEETLFATRPVFLAGFPRYFSPNNDGINDTWGLRGLDPFKFWNYVVFIFDRYGTFLAQVDDDNSNEWDGTVNGRPLPSSDYWFRLIYFDPDGNPVEARTVRSHFSLLRDILPNR